MTSSLTWNYLAATDVGVAEQIKYFPEYREQDSIYDIFAPTASEYGTDYFEVISSKYTTEESKRFFKDQIEEIVSAFNSQTVGATESATFYEAMKKLTEWMKAANPGLLDASDPSIELTTTSEYGELGIPTHEMVDVYRRIVNSYKAHSPHPLIDSGSSPPPNYVLEPWLRSEHTKEILSEAVLHANIAEVGYIREYTSVDEIGQYDFDNKVIDASTPTSSRQVLAALVTGYVDDDLTFHQSSSVATSSLQEIVKTEFVRDGYDQIIGAMAELKDAIELNSEILGALNEFQFLMNQKKPEQWSLAFTMFPIYQQINFIRSLYQALGEEIPEGATNGDLMEFLPLLTQSSEEGAPIFDIFKQISAFGTSAELTSFTQSEDDLLDKLYAQFEKASYDRELMPQVETITEDTIKKINELHNKWVQDYTFDEISLVSPNGTVYPVPEYSGSNVYGPYEDPNDPKRDLYFVSPDPAGPVRRGSLTSLQGSLLSMRHQLVKLASVDNDGNISYPASFEPLTDMINDIQNVINRRVDDQISAIQHKDSLDIARSIPTINFVTYEDVGGDTQDAIGEDNRAEYLTQKEVLYKNIIDGMPDYDGDTDYQLTDKYGDPITVTPTDNTIIEIIYWIGDNEDGVEGSNQRHLTQSIGSTESYSTEQREELRTEMLRFEEFLKASASIAAKLTSIIEKIASAISR